MLQRNLYHKNMSEKIDHDRLFKELISTFFIEFIELFFPEVLKYLDTNSVSLCYAKSADMLRYSVRLLLYYLRYNQIPVFN